MKKFQTKPCLKSERTCCARDIVVLNLIEEENIVLPMDGDIDGTLLIGVNYTPGSLVEGNFAKM